jgi:pyruvate/oxaloacetate carboxyltransferase
VVDAFVEKSLGNSIDIIRAFDALNDMYNVERAHLLLWRWAP